VFLNFISFLLFLFLSGLILHCNFSKKNFNFFLYIFKLF
jgi:hypothetical protein